MKFHPVNNLKYVDFNNKAYFQESLKYAGPLEEGASGYSRSYFYKPMHLLSFFVIWTKSSIIILESNEDEVQN